jgi:tryptophan synthase beta chain
MTAANTYRNQPDERGHFGQFGGRYVAETLMPLILDLEREYTAEGQGRPGLPGRVRRSAGALCRPAQPALFRAKPHRGLGGAQVWFKRDELNHTGAHKINNCIGQILLAIRMGKTRIIAETGAGQHGVATATVCARFGLPCVIYMGATDVARQAPNVFRMKLLGAEVRPVTAGAGTLKDAMNEALRDWVANVHDTFYIIGTAAGPHPYPELVRDFQSVIGKEAREQMLKRTGRLPDLLVAAIGGGSNAIGLFHPFLDDPASRCSASRRRATGSTRIMPHRSRADAPASSTATRPTCCRTMTARSSKATRSARASTIRGSGRNTPGCGRRPGRLYQRHG